MNAISRAKSWLVRLWRTLLAAPLKWKPLKRCDVLIYDACGAEVLTPYFSKYKVHVLPTRGESVHFWSFVCAIADPAFWKGRPTRAYFDACIRRVRPRVIATYIDNNIDFYCLAERFPNIISMFFQNGTRGTFGDVFGHLSSMKRYRVDYMLVHGASTGREYKKYISGDVMAIGSVRSNAVPRCTTMHEGGVLFVSQYHEKPADDGPLWREPDGTPIYWEQFIAADVAVVRFLARWCAENKMRLRICGRSAQGEVSGEKAFYAGLLEGSDWDFVPRIEATHSYRLADAADIVVFIDSTLGYESLGRGNRTAAFSCRMVRNGRTSHPFGWPAGLPDRGPFWTNHADDADFRGILDFLANAGDDEWKKTHCAYVSDIMEYNEDNTQLVEFLSCLLRSNLINERAVTNVQ